MGCQASAAMLVHCVTTLCWFLRWVLDEDERRAYLEHRAAYLARELAVMSGASDWREAWERFSAAEREMQRRGL